MSFREGPKRHRDGRGQSLSRKMCLKERGYRPQVFEKRSSLIKNFPEDVCSRESWLCLTFSSRGALTVGFDTFAVPFANQTRLIFESVLPLLPHRRRIPSPLSQSMHRAPSPRVASRERGQNAPSKKGQSVKPDSCINLRRSKILPGCPDGA